jgi:hypothetical protein
MKTITRYASILSACSVMATAGLFADSTADTTSRTTTNSADTVQSPSTQTPRSDNTMGTSGSTNNTSPNYNSSSSSSMNGSSSSMNSSRSADMTASTSALGSDDPLATSLQSTDYNNRSQLAQQVDQRIDSQKDTLKSLKKQGKHLEGQAKSDFKAAWDDVEAREKDLKHSVREVRNASSDRWDAARSQLASNYQAFEAAVSRLQTQIGADTMNSSSTTNSSNTMSR